MKAGFRTRICPLSSEPVLKRLPADDARQTAPSRAVSDPVLYSLNRPTRHAEIFRSLQREERKWTFHQEEAFQEQLYMAPVNLNLT